MTRGKLDAARATLATLHGESDSSGSSGNNGSNGHANPRAVSCTCQGAPSPSVGEDGGAVEKLFVELLQDIELELAGVQVGFRCMQQGCRWGGCSSPSPVVLSALEQLCWKEVRLAVQVVQQAWARQLRHRHRLPLLLQSLPLVPLPLL